MQKHKKCFTYITASTCTRDTSQYEKATAQKFFLRNLQTLIFGTIVLEQSIVKLFLLPHFVLLIIYYSV